MSDFEVMKECKQAYELLYDLLENCMNEFDDTNFKKVLRDLEDLYQKNWKRVSPKKEVKCFRCGKPLVISDLIDYAYVCENCDENMYLSECESGYAWWLEKECE